jgi:hypothetical protein
MAIHFVRIGLSNDMQFAFPTEDDDLIFIKDIKQHDPIIELEHIQCLDAWWINSEVVFKGEEK